MLLLLRTLKAIHESGKGLDALFVRPSRLCPPPSRDGSARKFVLCAVHPIKRSSSFEDKNVLLAVIRTDNGKVPGKVHGKGQFWGDQTCKSKLPGIEHLN